MPDAVRKGVIALAVAAVASTAYIWSYTETWDVAARLSPIMWLLFVGTNGLFVLLLVLTWRRRNWARWAAVVWTGLGILALLSSFVYFGEASVLDMTIQLAIAAIELWGCYHLVSKSASSWFHATAAA